jgi:TPR repeat protein
MGNTFSSEDTGDSPIIEAKSLLSQGDEAGAFAVLKKGAENGDVMACYDCGFMMIQGIGCEKILRGGLKLISKGVELEKESEDMRWKSDGSASELFEPQSMDLSSLYLLMNLVLNDHISS